MRARFDALALAAALIFLGAPERGDAAVVAAWDGSNFQSGGTVEDQSFLNVFNTVAQYSQLDTAADPTVGLGSGSAQFGRLYFDGQFGSTNTDPGGGAAGDFRGTSLNLSGDSSRATAPSSLQMSLSGSANALVAEGQVFGVQGGFAALGTLSAVFEADRSPAAGMASSDNWTVSFGGITTPGSGSIDVDVLFSNNGSAYTLVDTFTVTESEGTFTSSVSSSSADQAYYRFDLSDGVVIDNVAIRVPEPFAATGALAAFAAVGWVGARRRRL